MMFQSLVGLYLQLLEIQILTHDLTTIYRSICIQLKSDLTIRHLVVENHQVMSCCKRRSLNMTS